MAPPTSLPVKPKDLYRPLHSRDIFPAPHPLIAALGASPTAQLETILLHRPSWFPLFTELRQQNPAAYSCRVAEAAVWFSDWQVLEHRMALQVDDEEDLEAIWRELRGRMWMWFHEVAPNREWLADAYLPKSYNAYVGEWQKTWVLRDVREALDITETNRFLEALEEDFDLYRRWLVEEDVLGHQESHSLERVYRRWLELDEDLEEHYRYGTGLHRIFINEWPEVMDASPGEEYSENSFRARMQRQRLQGLPHPRTVSGDPGTRMRGERSIYNVRNDSGSQGPWS